MNVTAERLAALFAEWQRRYREEPEKFATEWETAAMGLEGYGQTAAAYLLRLAGEIPEAAAA